MPAPETTIAGARPAAQPSTPNAIIPVAPPVSSRRARAVSTRSIRPGWPTSSVSHATSAPPENAQPRPHSTWVTRSQRKVVTARSHHAGGQEPVPDHQRPLPAERVRPDACRDSDSTRVSAMTAPSRTSCAADRWAFDDEIQTGGQHVAPVEHRPQERPAQEHRRDAQASPKPSLARAARRRTRGRRPPAFGLSYSHWIPAQRACRGNRVSRTAGQVSGEFRSLLLLDLGSIARRERTRRRERNQAEGTAPGRAGAGGHGTVSRSGSSG